MRKKIVLTCHQNQKLLSLLILSFTASIRLTQHDTNYEKRGKEFYKITQNYVSYC